MFEDAVYVVKYYNMPNEIEHNSIRQLIQDDADTAYSFRHEDCTKPYCYEFTDLVSHFSILNVYITLFSTNEKEIVNIWIESQWVYEP